MKDFTDPDRLAEDTDRLMADLRTELAVLDGQLAVLDILRAAPAVPVAPDLPHGDAPLRLADAACLPELGGKWSGDERIRRPSATVSVKAMRSAISAGRLTPVSRDGKNIFITRRSVQDWMDTWQDQETAIPSSSSGRPATTDRVASRTAPSGSSMTTASRSSTTPPGASTLALSAREIVKQLRLSARPTRPGGTPRS